MGVTDVTAYLPVDSMMSAKAFIAKGLRRGLGFDRTRSLGFRNDENTQHISFLSQLYDHACCVDAF